MNLRQSIFDALEKEPTLTNKQLYNLFPKGNRTSIRVYANEMRNRDPGNIHVITKSNKHTSTHKSSTGGVKNPSLSNNPLNITLDQIRDMDWKQKLELAFLGIPPFDKANPAFLSMYDKLGFLNQDIEKTTGERYIYKEPEWLYPHQREMLSIMRQGSCIFWGMRQLTGKTTTALVGCNEKCYEYANFQMVHISPSEKLSKELLAKTQMDQKLYELYKQQTRAFYRESVIFMNGSRIIIRPCKVSSVQGLTGGLWIDELDKILLEKDKTAAFAGLLPVAIKPMLEGKAFIWITCNQATGQAALAFEYFKSIIMQFGRFFKVCEIKEPTPGNKERYVDVLNDFDPKIPEDPFEKEQWYIDFIYELQKALMGEEFAAAQMKNIYLDLSGIWSKQDVLNAFQSYNEAHIPKWDHVDNAILGIDPGAVHGTGLVICLRDMESHHLYITIAEKMYGTEHSEAEILGRIVALYDEWNCDKGVSETNSGGWLWVKDLSDRGYNFYSANFGTSSEQTGMVSSGQKTVERQWKEKVLKYHLENNLIHIVKSQELLREFSLYNPYENKEKGKGDIMDALLHAVFECAGGIDFALKIGEEEQPEEDRKVAYTS